MTLNAILIACTLSLPPSGIRGKPDPVAPRPQPQKKQLRQETPLPPITMPIDWDEYFEQQKKDRQEQACSWAKKQADFQKERDRVDQIIRELERRIKEAERKARQGGGIS